ncbi:MAG: TIGR02996 domain-containing protein [Planctomycetia bacterium]|nr:TIGR02996 domain-containing protein [Planctomycetia bacterium]
MSDEAAFLRAIQANPADSTAKLVYADWLDEHGEQERAEYVRDFARRDGTYKPPMRSHVAPLSLRGPWLDLFHNRVPLWDPVTRKTA